MIDLKQLQEDIRQLADEHHLTSFESRSDLTRLRQLLQSLIDFRENILQKSHMHTDEEIYQFLDRVHVDAEIQTMENTDLSIRIQELLQIEDNDDQLIVNRIQEILDQNQQLRNLVETNTVLNENYQKLSDEHQELLQSSFLSLHCFHFPSKSF